MNTTFFTEEEIAVLEEIHDRNEAERDCWEQRQSKEWEEAREYCSPITRNIFEE